MNAAAAERAWWSQAVMIGAVVALVLLPIGALGSRLGIWSFGTGFLFLGGGAVLAIIGLLGGRRSVLHRRLLHPFLDRQRGASM